MKGSPERTLIYLGEVENLPEERQDPRPRLIARRGITLGWLTQAVENNTAEPEPFGNRWQAAQPIALPGFLLAGLDRIQGEIRQTEQMVENILQGEEPSDLLGARRYAERLSPGFEFVSSIYDESDDQEIEKLEFEAVQDGRTLAQDLWLKVAWLSFFEEDASLRFRFSFGMENYEDVAADLPRERLAARLCDAIFPESRIVTENPELRSALCQIIGIADLEYIERIVYFNGPQGGAQFHHDVERGHLGVIFAQLTGQTAWLALSTEALLAEIRLFLESADAERVMSSVSDPAIKEGLRRYQTHPERLQAELNDSNNETIEVLLNQVPEFFAQLVRHGHAYVLAPGDVLLLPQQSMHHCAWHSVYCLGDEMGEGLSFAIREVG